MADKKISELVSITGSATAADDYFVVVDTSGAVTYKISREELNNAIEQDVLENISITNLTSDLNTNGNDITFGDNDKIRLGDASDLLIYHDGSHSVINEQGTGNLKIIGSDISIEGSGETFATFVDDGAVTLYHDNAAKLYTTATGVDVSSTDATVNFVSSRGTGATHTITTGGANSGNFNINAAAGGDIYVNAENKIFRNAAGSTEHMRISSGFVGIGESAPKKMLHITKNNSDGVIVLDANGTTTDHQICFSKDYGTGGTTGGNYWGIGVDGSENKLVFAYDPNAQASLSVDAKIVIDSSGNLLVSKTSDDNTTVGGAIRNTGVAAFVADGNHPLIINRKTSDGDLISLRKDGTTVGSVASTTRGGATDIFIGSGDTGIYFTQALDAVAPSNQGSDRDAAIDLGRSANRFKDLYLSGGVYLGGTGSANYLDDYEEGTWTPTANLGTVSGTNCVYRKIGSQVTVWGLISNFSDRTSSSAVQIGGLPFSVDASSDDVAVGSAMWSFSNVDGGTVYIDSTTKLQFYAGASSSSFTALSHNSLNLSSALVYLCATYTAA